MDITDGGNTLKIKEDRRATVEAKSDFQLAAEAGDAYIWAIESYDFTAVDTVLLVRNDNSSKTLHITKVIVESDATLSEVEIHRVTAAFTIAGTAVVGTNLLPGGSAADATAKATETGNTQGTVIERRQSHASTPLIVDFEGAVELNNAQAIGIDLATGGDWVMASIWGYFK